MLFKILSRMPHYIWLTCLFRFLLVWHFPERFLMFMALTVLRNIGQLFCRMAHNWDLSLWGSLHVQPRLKMRRVMLHLFEGTRSTYIRVLHRDLSPSPHLFLISVFHHLFLSVWSHIYVFYLPTLSFYLFLHTGAQMASPDPCPASVISLLLWLPQC